MTFAKKSGSIILMKIPAKNYDKNWTQKVPENAEFGATKTFNIRNFLIFELVEKFLNKMGFNFKARCKKLERRF